MNKKYFPHTILQSLGVVLLFFIYTAPLVSIEKKLFRNDHSHFNAVAIIFLIASILTILTIFYVNYRKHIRIIFNLKINHFHFLTLTIIILILFQIALDKPFSFIINSLLYPDKTIDNPFQSLGLIVGALLIAPIVEEIIFRGMILKGLLTNYSPKKAIIISSLIFGFLHPHPTQFLGALLIGLFLGWIYYKTKSLGNTILLHFVANTFSLLAGYINFNFGSNDIANIYGEWSIYIIFTSLILLIFLAFVLFNDSRKI